jgi:hypothetical protein
MPAVPVASWRQERWIRWNSTHMLGQVSLRLWYDGNLMEVASKLQYIYYAIAISEGSELLADKQSRSL